MKTLKKIGLIIGMAVFMLHGNKAEAADMQADEIVAKVTEAMKNVKVFQADSYTVENGVESEVPTLTFASDKNGAGIYYVQLVGYKAWADEKAKMKYVFNPTTGKYTFVPLEKNTQPVKVTEDNTSVDTMELILDMVLETLRGVTTEQIAGIDKEKQEISYLGEELFHEIDCYKLKVISKEDNADSIWYIEKDNYRILAITADATVEAEEGKTQQIYQDVYFSYPDMVVIPDEVKKKAVLKSGYQFTKSNISYCSKLVKGKPVLYVTKSEKAKNTVKIPNTIQISGKAYKVYGIEAKAFYNNSKIKSVTVGNNVSTIGDKAFYNNKKITSLTIGKNVKTIGKQTFYKCKKLKNVKINSKNITKIGSKAFFGNAKTLKFKVPKKKATKYKRLLNKSKVSSKLVISKY